MPPSETSRQDRRINETAVDWVLRLEGEPLSRNERQELDAWLEKDAAHGRAFARAQRLFSDSGDALASDPEQAKRVIAGNRLNGTLRVLIPVILIVGGFFLADGPLRLQADVISGSHDMPMVDLPDGSRIYMNAESALSKTQQADLREVTLLRGEAYFEVARDPARPFIVTAGDARIEVLGTAFNVNRIGGRIEVTVIEHTVRVTGSVSDQEAVLHPGMRVVYNGDGSFGPVETVATEFETSWRSGRLVFEEQPLSRVVEEVFRHIPGDAVIVGADTRARHVSGSFDLSDPEAALDSFASVFGLRMVRAGGMIAIIY